MPKPGDFGLVAIRGNVGKLIRFGQWLNGDGFGDYQHAVLALSNGELIEAEPGRGGARIRSQSEYADTNIVWSDWPLTDDERARLDVAGRKRERTPYSALDYFALVAHRLRIPIPGLRRYIDSSKHEICSQLVDLVYKDAGLVMFADGRWSGYVTPMSLVRALHGPVTA
jgi:hypothetical protein